MTVYTVVGIYDGVPTDIEVFANAESAKARGFELATEYDLLERHPDEDASQWSRESGTTRFWRHHWFNDQRDIVVAEAVIT